MRNHVYNNTRLYKVSHLLSMTDFEWQKAHIKHTHTLTYSVSCLSCSGFSPEVVFHTTGSLPQMPLAPRLLQTGASWVELEWSRPSSYGPDEVLTYTLEMQDETKVTHTHTHTGVNMQVLPGGSCILEVFTSSVTFPHKYAPSCDLPLFLDTLKIRHLLTANRFRRSSQLFNVSSFQQDAVQNSTSALDKVFPGFPRGRNSQRSERITHNAPVSLYM